MWRRSGRTGVQAESTGNDAAPPKVARRARGWLFHHDAETHFQRRRAIGSTEFVALPHTDVSNAIPRTRLGEKRDTQWPLVLEATGKAKLNLVLTRQNEPLTRG
jgi:hypothetical protein